MEMKLYNAIVSRLSRVRSGLLLLLVFTIFLGLINWLLVNQRVVLYLFYLPVVFAALTLPRRGAVAVGSLAAMLVIAYSLFRPDRLDAVNNRMLLHAELAIWGGILVVTAYMVSTLQGRTRQAMRNLDRAYRGVLAILSRFIQMADADTEAHSVRVSAWAVRIAGHLSIDKAQMEEVRIAGLLHDVGKVDVSVELLRKTAALSEEEQRRVREHTTLGADMVKPVGGMLTHIADAIEASHEKYDGTGYKGMRGEEIPLVARIIAVADAFDAMLSDRPYRKGVSILEAMDNIVSHANSHFDPRVVDGLHKIVQREGEWTLSQGLMPSVAAAGGQDQ